MILVKELCNQHDIDIQEFEEFLYAINAPIRPSSKGMLLREREDEILAQFFEEKNNVDLEESRLKEEFEKNKLTIQTMPIIAGDHFEGFKITKYGQMVSRATNIAMQPDVVGLKLPAHPATMVTNSLQTQDEQVRMELRKEAHKQGCNALICFSVNMAPLEYKESSVSLVNGANWQHTYDVLFVFYHAVPVLIEPLENAEDTIMEVQNETNF